LPGILDWLKAARSYQREICDHYQFLLLQQAWKQKNVNISPTAMIHTDGLSQLSIGPGSVIGPYSILHLLSDPNNPDPTPSVITIGKEVSINEFNNLRAAGGCISIADHCLISQFVSIIATNHSTEPGRTIVSQPWDLKKANVIIEEDVWIGANAVILPGSCISSGSVIAAGAVVNGFIPEYSIAGGIPARVIGSRK
jgi:acetyltransferase-like isoleucine patch superfamily enzyme